MYLINCFPRLPFSMTCARIHSIFFCMSIFVVAISRSRIRGLTFFPIFWRTNLVFAVRYHFSSWFLPDVTCPVFLLVSLLSPYSYFFRFSQILHFSCFKFTFQFVSALDSLPNLKNRSVNCLEHCHLSIFFSIVDLRKPP